MEKDVGVVGLLKRTSLHLDKDADNSHDMIQYQYKICKYETDVEEVVFCSCCFCCKNLSTKHTISCCFNLEKYTVSDIKDKILQKAFFSISLSRVLIMLNLIFFLVSYSIVLESYHLIFGFLPAINTNTSLSYILLYSMFLSIISFLLVKAFTFLINKHFKAFSSFLFAALIVLLILIGIIVFPIMNKTTSNGFTGAPKPFTAESVVIETNNDFNT